MPFAESSQTLRSKLHLTDVSMPVIIGVLALCALVGVLAVHNIATALNEPAFTIESFETASGEADGSEGGSDAAGSDDSQEAQKTVVVFVSGCVEAPGVYELAEGSRVADAVKAAGGFAEGASTDSVNLARALNDGEQIDIVSQEEAEASSAAASGTGSTESSGSASGSSSSATGLVNLNTASQSDLESLPGIGPSTAQKIIASREQEGPFTSKEDVKRVSGIGDKKYQAIADLITV